MSNQVIKTQNKYPETYQISISDITCQHCVSRVEKIIASIDGVEEGNVNLVERAAQVCGGDPNKVVQAIIDQGYDARLVEKKPVSNTYSLKLSKDYVDKALSLLNEHVEVKRCQVNNAIGVSGDTFQHISVTTHLHPAKLILFLQHYNIAVRIVEEFTDPREQQEQLAKQEIRQSWYRSLAAGIVGIGLLVGMKTDTLPAISSDITVFNFLNPQSFWFIVAIICLITMWFSGKNYYITALKQAKYRSANMDTLVALGTSAAWLSSMMVIINPDIFANGGHLYLDAAVFILAFLNFGHALEVKAKRVTARAISSLIELAPKNANLLINYQGHEHEVQLPVSVLIVGDRITIRPGERIPIDGIVLKGKSTIDESMLSGEPDAVSKIPGDKVIGGTINGSGQFVFEVDALSDDTTLSHIIEMVRQAQISKPDIGRLVDKVASFFVPAVIAIAIIAFIIWFIFGPQPNLSYALTTGIAVLVIACPCALGLATPIAIMMGTGKAAEYNILIKNSDALQTASRLTHLVVDKTGTLTKGKPDVTLIKSFIDDNNQVLQLAASLEQFSEHPIAQTIINKARDQKLKLLTVTDFMAIQGRGVQGIIDNQKIILGNKKMINENAITIPEDLDIDFQQTVIYLAIDHQLTGVLTLDDPIRDDSYEAIKNLQSMGLKIVMCTGDNKQTASNIASKLNIDTLYAELLPEDKLKVISELQSQGCLVGMVGDGINDAPALAKANTGFAIGSGTDVAIENADITLAGNSLQNVCTAIAISSATIRNIKQNLFGAFIYNIIGIPLAAGMFYPLTGWLLAPAFASAAMALSSVTVVINANRLRFFKG